MIGWGLYYPLYLGDYNSRNPGPQITLPSSPPRPQQILSYQKGSYGLQDQIICACFKCNFYKKTGKKLGMRIVHDSAIIIQERGIPFLTNQDSMKQERGFDHCSLGGVVQSRNTKNVKNKDKHMEKDEMIDVC